MTETLKILGQVNTATAVTALLYSAPTTGQTMVSTLFVANSSSAATFSVWVTPATVASATVHLLYPTVDIPAGEVFRDSVGLTLNSGATVTVKPSHSSCIFHLFGSEIT